jgi:hypothetical protein
MPRVERPLNAAWAVFWIASAIISLLFGGRPEAFVWIPIELGFFTWNILTVFKPEEK